MDSDILGVAVLYCADRVRAIFTQPVVKTIISQGRGRRRIIALVVLLSLDDSLRLVSVLLFSSRPLFSHPAILQAFFARPNLTKSKIEVRTGIAWM